jgi:heat-inducible transcriptional repressor
VGSIDEPALGELRAGLNAQIVGRRLAEVPGLLADLAQRLPGGAEAQAAGPPPAAVDALCAVLLEMIVEQREERVMLGGTANLARFGQDFPDSIHPVLEALEEQVVLLKLLGEATAPSLLTVRIGRENGFDQLTTTSVVTSGYGRGEDTLAQLGVLGPTRMDYPGTMGAVSAVARYVGRILEQA